MLNRVSTFACPTEKNMSNRAVALSEHGVEELALISYKRLQHSLMLKLILFDTVYLAKTH